MTPASDASVGAPVLASVAEVHFSYGPTSVLVGVSFELRAAELCALVGPNGSGKTTLLRVLLGLLAPQGGAATTGSTRIGYVPQRAYLSDSIPATVNEVVSTGLLNARIHGAPGGARRPSRSDAQRSIDRVVEAVGLAGHGDARFTSLSGGQQQRVLIARAMVREPQLLVLDEPVAGVDAASQEAFRDVLVHAVGGGASVLLVSHELSAVARDLDRVIVLRHGAVEFDGPPARLEAAGVSLGIHAHDLPVWLERES